MATNLGTESASGYPDTIFSVCDGRVPYFNYVIIRHAPESMSSSDSALTKYPATIYPNLVLDSINVLEDEYISVGAIIGTNDGTYLNEVSEDLVGNFGMNDKKSKNASCCS